MSWWQARMLQSGWKEISLAAALAAFPAAARADNASPNLLSWQGGAIALDLPVSGKDDAGAKGGATFNLSLPDLPLQVQASTSAGQSPDGAALWQKQSTSVSLALPDTGPVSLSTRASDQTTATWFAQAPGEVDAGTHSRIADARSASFALSSPLFSGLALNVGTDARTGVSDDLWRNGTGETRTRISNDDVDAFATLSFRFGPSVSASAGVTAEGFSTGWHALNAGDQRADFLAPKLTFSFAPWRGAKLAIDAEEAVTPCDDAVFATLAALPLTGISPKLEPDHAWRYATTLTQNLGDAKVTATVAQSVSGTATELAETASGTAPESVPLAESTEANVSVALPLAGLGLDGYALSSDTSIASSRVKDPVTGEERMATGAVPYQSHVAITHKLAADLSVGVKGGYTGPVITYRPSETSNAAAGPDIGAFLAYKPGTWEFDLAADGLAGARAADDRFYVLTRADSTVARIDQRAVDGPSLSLALKKAF